ncbi:MAG: M28 family metallopeptidase [Acidobacteriota bacterium]|nr:M28 family metallopeptidase [Acidobacteriota bacterium]
MNAFSRSLILISALSLAACGSGETGAPSGSTPAATPPTPEMQMSALPNIDQARVLEHIKALASDEFAGRLPGTKGEELTVRYISDQFKAAGLAPGNPDGTWVQKVPLVGITGKPSPLTIANASQQPKPVTLAYGADMIAWSRHVADRVDVAASDMIFVGYGVEAPEFGWDDYKGIDTKGKTLVMLVNDPLVPGTDGAPDPKVFGGPAMTYYGRWTYKYEKGAEKGAAAVLIVHETGPAGYGWNVVQGFGGERFDLETPGKNLNRAKVEGWMHLDRARELFKSAGQDFDALKKAATSKDFKPVPLGVKASISVQNTMRRVQSQNVIGKLAGADPVLRDEHVIYAGHWDHLGTGNAVNGDTIYNGAVDNATGVAAIIEIARAFKQVQPAAKRSVLFLAVTAEEQGLLGSEYYATNPLYPLNKTAANINIDAMNPYGRTTDLVIIGMGASELDDYAKAAADEQGRTLKADPEPEKGYYYRSDHFNFAKVGVPALYADGGVDYVGKPGDWGRKKMDEHTATRYHQPSDQITPDWDLSGLAEDAKFFFAVGYRVANAARLPQWRAGNEFKAIRDKSMGR